MCVLASGEVCLLPAVQANSCLSADEQSRADACLVAVVACSDFRLLFGNSNKLGPDTGQADLSKTMSARLTTQLSVALQRVDGTSR